MSLLETLSEITFSKVDKNPKFELFSSSQQVSEPLWQVGPLGFTWTNKVSLSQSNLISTKFRTFPLS